ncbi:hypothetical protein RB195_006310 [Necator americanus]|uniref:Reverse transcriptase domain-containing protein n=1 Tax=Necator americanus TaxID=51031 RepID=A0ABR1BS02_NECAM
MCEVLECIILDRLIRHHEETIRDELAGLRPGGSLIDQVFILRRMIEVWQRSAKLLQLAFFDFEAAFDSPHRLRVLKALCADVVAVKFASLMNNMNRRKTAAVRTTTECTTSYKVETAVRQGTAAKLFLCRR